MLSIQVGGLTQVGAPIWPPHPQPLGAPRQSRDAPRQPLLLACYPQPATATEPSPSAGSGGGGASKLMMLSSGFTASPPGVRTSTLV